MEIMQYTVYSLCVLTSLAVTVLLLRAYLRTQTRLLLWSAVCFSCLTVNNLILFVDLLVFPDVDMYIVRTLSTVAGLAFLIFGFIWDTE